MYIPSLANQFIVATGVGAAPVKILVALRRPNPFLIFFLISYEIIGIFNKIFNFF